jgi:hypothetical protein
MDRKSMTKKMVIIRKPAGFVGNMNVRRFSAGINAAKRALQRPLFGAAQIHWIRDQALKAEHKLKLALQKRTKIMFLRPLSLFSVGC